MLGPNRYKITNYTTVFIDVFLMVIAVYGINFFVPRFLLIVLG